MIDYKSKPKSNHRPMDSVIGWACGLLLAAWVITAIVKQVPLWDVI